MATKTREPAKKGVPTPPRDRSSSPSAPRGAAMQPPAVDESRPVCESWDASDPRVTRLPQTSSEKLAPTQFCDPAVEALLLAAGLFDPQIEALIASHQDTMLGRSTAKRRLADPDPFLKPRIVGRF